MTDLNAHHADHLKELMDQATDPTTPIDDRLKLSKLANDFSHIQLPAPEQEPDPAPVPTTRREKALARTAAILDNETTRAFIKAAGALGGVGLVVWSTVHRDHVLERQALAQANQRPN